jgi:hypothetical protein
MTSEQFRISLARRLGEVIPDIPRNKICTCKNKTVVDEKGVHLESCMKMGLVIKQHDELVRELRNFVKAHGLEVEIEPILERGTDGRSDNCYRGDLAISVLFRGYQKVVLDIRICNPLLPSNISAASVMNPGEAAEKGAKGKVASYIHRGIIAEETLSSPDGWTFIPFIAESYGALNVDAINFIRDITNRRAKVIGVKASILYRYWMKRISVCIQKNVANTILGRSFELCSADIHGFDFSTSKEFMSDAEQMDLRTFYPEREGK